MDKKALRIGLVIVGLMCLLFSVFKITQENKRFSFENNKEKIEENKEIVEEKEDVSNNIKEMEMTGDIEYVKNNVHKYLTMLATLILILLLMIFTLRLVIKVAFISCPFLRDIIGGGFKVGEDVREDEREAWKKKF